MKRELSIYRASDNRSRGFTLIDLMVAIGLSALIAISTISVITYASRERAERNQISSLFAIREQLFNILSRYTNFQDTVYYINNTTFACVQNRTTCVGLPTGLYSRSFALVLRNNTSPAGATFVYYNPTSVAAPYYGFDQDGIVCTSTSATPNRDCPIKVDFFWSPICTTGLPPACVPNPQLISVRVLFRTYRDATGGEVPRAFDFTILKSVYDNGYTPVAPPYPP